MVLEIDGADGPLEMWFSYIRILKCIDFTIPNRTLLISLMLIKYKASTKPQFYKLEKHANIMKETGMICSDQNTGFIRTCQLQTFR